MSKVKKRISDAFYEALHFETGCEDALNFAKNKVIDELFELKALVDDVMDHPLVVVDFDGGEWGDTDGSLWIRLKRLRDAFEDE